MHGAGYWALAEGCAEIRMSDLIDRGIGYAYSKIPSEFTPH